MCNRRNMIYNKPGKYVAYHAPVYLLGLLYCCGSDMCNRRNMIYNKPGKYVAYHAPVYLLGLLYWDTFLLITNFTSFYMMTNNR